MQKRVIIIVMAAIFIVGTISVAYAQQDIIDKLKIISIQSVQVRDKDEKGNNLDYIFLDVKTRLANSNDRDIRLRDGVFTFYASSVYQNREISKREIAPEVPEKGRDECKTQVSEKDADKKKEIGKAAKPFFMPSLTPDDCKNDDCKNSDCKNVDHIILKPGGDTDPNVVMFHVKLGRTQTEAMRSLMHLMNCIGNPGVKIPHINIEGKFDLGIKSNKGWSEVEAVKIEWLFIPKMQEDRVNFMTSAD
ncbi:hypothetical protein QUF80_03790 [Desulfococcaceae bacterium HSG8]|nr:hypothetical protein [Desulfococcaceae bacterium HSG8]